MKLQVSKTEKNKLGPVETAWGSTAEADASSTATTQRKMAAIANQSEHHTRMLGYQRMANSVTSAEAPPMQLTAANTSGVMQMMWMSEDGREISDADWDELDTLIDKYDVDVGDIDKGGDEKELGPGQIAIGIALTNLKIKLVEMAGGSEKRAKLFWNGIIGKGKRDNHVGGLWTAIEMAETGRQCNNEMAIWIRNCLVTNFNHFPDEE